MAPVAFQIMSDLHLETHGSYDFDVKFAAPYLALLGDVGHCGDDRLYGFLERLLRRHWAVFFLLGNHEPQGSTWEGSRARVRAFAARMESLRTRSTIGRFVFLDRTRHDLTPTLTVLGCTLFTRIPQGDHRARDVAAALQDFRTIRDWGVAEHNAAHDGDLAWLNAQVRAIQLENEEAAAAVVDKSSRRQVVVFTHHCPTADARASDPRHREDGKTDLSSGFVVDLRGEPCWTSRDVVMWGFGHNHWNCDFEDEHGKRVVANQKGYKTIPEKEFVPKKCFLVGT